METSKLYSEIEKLLPKEGCIDNNELYGYCKDKDCTLSDGRIICKNTQNAAKSIEQLLLEKMEDFINWANKSWYYDDEVDKWVRYGQVSHSTKELIQLYLNRIK